MVVWPHAHNQAPFASDPSVRSFYPMTAPHVLERHVSNTPVDDFLCCFVQCIYFLLHSIMTRISTNLRSPSAVPLEQAGQCEHSFPPILGGQPFFISNGMLL